MAGIVKIPSEQVSSFDTHETTQKLAHHFLSTLKNVDNVVNSGAEFSTFNPFVVGSTPAGPTKFKSTLYLRPKCFFMVGCFFRSAHWPLRAIGLAHEAYHGEKMPNGSGSAWGGHVQQLTSLSLSPLRAKTSAPASALPG